VETSKTYATKPMQFNHLSEPESREIQIYERKTL